MKYTFSIANDTAQSLVVGFTLKTQIQAAGLTSVSHIETNGDVLDIHFTAALAQNEQDTLAATVAAHTGKTSAEQLADYLNSTVHPFCEDLINTFAAENISMGVTQAGKTAHLLGLFTKKYPIPSESLGISLKACFDSGSLYAARDVIQYVRDNPSEFDGLSPFVTDARLLSMKNKIETFLGLPPSS
jgi:hypothetical protein